MKGNFVVFGEVVHALLILCGKLGSADSGKDAAAARAVILNPQYFSNQPSIIMCDVLAFAYLDAVGNNIQFFMAVGLVS